MTSITVLSVGLGTAGICVVLVGLIRFYALGARRLAYNDEASEMMLHRSEQFIEEELMWLRSRIEAYRAASRDLDFAADRDIRAPTDPLAHDQWREYHWKLAERRADRKHERDDLLKEQQRCEALVREELALSYARRQQHAQHLERRKQAKLAELTIRYGNLVNLTASGLTLLFAAMAVIALGRATEQNLSWTQGKSALTISSKANLREER